MNFLLKLFDEREGFASVGANEVGANASTEEEETYYEEVSYTVPSHLQKQEQFSDDATMISEIQEKMNNLLKLNEEATIINNNINKLK
jgi:hypothetical protein